jgi:hypothetical protein
MRRTVWAAGVAIAVVLATWLVLYLVVGVGGDSGPTVTHIDRSG